MTYAFRLPVKQLDNVGIGSLSEIDRLTSITATAGETLIFTHDGTDATLTNSLGNFNLTLSSTSFSFINSATFPRIYATAGDLIIHSAADDVFLANSTQSRTLKFKGEQGGQ